MVARHPTPGIAWPGLRLQQRLSKGDSGVIWRADWPPAHRPTRVVAVKLFKGATTSDGLPRSKGDACLVAGRHPHLIGVLGRVTDRGRELQARGLQDASAARPLFATIETTLA